MTIYILMVSTDCNQVQTPRLAYYNKEAANEARRIWNTAQETEDRKNADEAGRTYDDWVGNYPDYAFIEKVEIIGEPIKSK